MCLSRQDTLPAEDPSWSYPQVSGQVAPIPPRNEPMLYIPNIVDDSNVQATTLYMKNLQLNVPSTTPKSILYDTRTYGTSDTRIETLMTSAANIIIRDSGTRGMDSLVCVIDIASFHTDFGFLNQRIQSWMTMPSYYLRWSGFQTYMILLRR
jgi:hypothetical protein